MRHLSGYRRLSRKEDHRRALLRNLATSLVIHEHVDTTLAKAKEVQSVVERLITLGKRGDLHARRRAAAYFYGNDAVVKVFSTLADRYRGRPGGYTRVLKRGIRFGDGAKLASLQLIEK